MTAPLTEHPILFSTEMVKAILEGRKTQTRRVVKSPSWWEGHLIHAAYHGMYYDVLSSRDGGKQKDSPYGIVGDRLWVRETWATHKQFDRLKPSDILEGAPIWRLASFPKHPEQMGKVRPSIFMPRWASRITLEITNIRVERVQEISDRDCEVEGVRPSVDGDAKDWLPNETGWKRTYRQLWDSINGKRKCCSWEDNPWVWIIEFERWK